MKTEHAMDDLETILTGTDLHTRLALRALLAASDEEGWMSAEQARRDVEAELSRAEVTLTDSAPLAPKGMGPTEEERNRVLLSLAEQGLILPEPAPAAAAETDAAAPAERVLAWQRVRLAPALRSEAAAAFRAQLEQRTEAELSGAVAGAPRAVPKPHGSTLSARGLVKVYRKRRVVNDVELRLSQGEIVGLLGPNGAGKTTTFYMMVGLIAPDAGKVMLDGDDVTRVPMYKRARRGIGYLAQEPSVFRKLTVEENVMAILQMMDIPRRERQERLERLLDELGIKHLRKAKGYALSGGERRRLEITRALVGEPKFMLLDEPFAGVDPIAVHDIQQIVADLRTRGIGVLISDHNVEQTLDIVDRAYIMYEGRVRVSGTVSELVWNDEVAEIYLGPTLTARMRQRYPFPG